MPTRVLLGLIAIAAGLSAQTITGNITGSVRDASNLAVPGADVLLISVSTQAERGMKTNESGDFFFATLNPGEYRLQIKSAGFKPAERKGINLSASETLALGGIPLEVGNVTESVTVSAQSAAVQTASSERAGSITSAQVENLLIRGRNVISLVSLLPGVVDMQESEAIDRNWNFSAQGGRRATNNVTLDGMTMNQIGNNFNAAISVSQDSIAEVKVLLSNYQAEYGRMSGANIQLISKSGTKDFHGLFSYFKRHEQFNANNFFNNRLGAANPRYRYNTYNYSVSGPVYVPGRFNRNKDKLFFSWSQEFWPLRTPQPIRQLTVPTDLERAGDFSQSLDLNNRLIAITDPNSRQPFAGNRIPASRLDPNGVALLKVFPQPNFLDKSTSAGRYNYVFQAETTQPQRMSTLKLDYNLNANNLVAFNMSRHSDEREGSQGIPTTGPQNWDQLVKKFSTRGKVYVGRYSRIFSPTLVNELSIGFNTRPEGDSYREEELARNQRDKVGFKTGQFNPSSNPLNYIPNATFGGVTNPAALQIEGRFPLDQTQKIFSLTNNVTKTVGAHTVKMGIYADRIWRGASNAVAFNGTFDFGRNVNNPLDSNFAYSNAALGVFNSYTEASSRPFLNYRVTNLEWFAQDNWKVTRRLTLDYGMRFAEVFPINEAEDRVSGFNPGLFDRAKQAQLIRPAIVGGQRVGVHPVTGATYPASQIGAIAPGTGTSSNGMALPYSDKSYPQALIKNRGIQFGPRVGFAWDPSGNGSTSVRGGFGVFYNRQSLDVTLNNYTTQPPLVETPLISFGTLPTLLSSGGLLYPSNVLGIDPEGHVPTTMNFSFNVQRRLPGDVIVDAGYVGSLSRHMMWQRNLNAIPFGANFNPANADPTNTRVPLSPQFLRTYTGYNNINYREFASSSNYHSLQVSANRRFKKGVQFGASWTWSKALDYNDNDNDTVSTLIPVRQWNYGLAGFDRRHVLKANWVWDLPKSHFRNLVMKGILNDWQMSGVVTFSSGAPLSIGFSQVTATDITGSPTDGARIDVLSNPVLPKSERTFSRNFRTDVFRVPAVGTYGTSAPTSITGPGVNNWDTAVFKTFPVREVLRLQFRCELYNAFNHTQFTTLDTAARFDALGAQVNGRFGEFTAARNARIMQFAVRASF